MTEAAFMLHAPDAAATDAIGAALAGVIAPGMAVLLHGDLGAGKSALARAFIRASEGDPALEVPSPTFALVQPYDHVLHSDLYRLGDESELEELGLFDAPEKVLLVEWPGRAPALTRLPGIEITLAMAPGGEGRFLTIASRKGVVADPIRAALARWLVAP